MSTLAERMTYAQPARSAAIATVPTFNDKAKASLAKHSQLVNAFSNVDFYRDFHETSLRDALNDVGNFKREIENLSSAEYMQNEKLLSQFDKLEGQLNSALLDQLFYKREIQTRAVAGQVFQELKDVFNPQSDAPVQANNAPQLQAMNAQPQVNGAPRPIPIVAPRFLKARNFAYSKAKTAHNFAGRMVQAFKRNYPEQAKTVGKLAEDYAKPVADRACKVLSGAYNKVARPVVRNSSKFAKTIASSVYNAATRENAAAAYDVASGAFHAAKAKTARAYKVTKIEGIRRYELAKLRTKAGYLTLKQKTTPVYNRVKGKVVGARNATVRVTSVAANGLKKGAVAVAKSPITYGVAAAATAYVLKPYLSGRAIADPAQMIDSIPYAESALVSSSNALTPYTPPTTVYNLAWLAVGAGVYGLGKAAMYVKGAFTRPPAPQQPPRVGEEDPVEEAQAEEAPADQGEPGMVLADEVAHINDVADQRLNGGEPEPGIQPAPAAVIQPGEGR